MKLVKMSLVAAMVMGASAFAIDNVKVSGDAKLFYGTDNADYEDADGNIQSGLFDQGASAGQAALSLGITADLTKGVSAGAKLYAISTLGLENNLVNNVWESGLKDQYWFGEAWLAATAGKTTGKIGRMELETPLVFTEKWSIVPNTFEAAVLINQDITDTTLVGAYIGKSNGSNANTGGAGYGGVINSFENISYYNNNNMPGYQTGSSDDQISDQQSNNFGSFHNGAYAVGAINNTLKPLVVQAWYYNVVKVADAFWLQADWDCQLIKDVKVGVQYADISLKAAGTHDADAYAIQLGYTGITNLKVSTAYSSTNDKGDISIQNLSGSGVSKLYTEARWNYGYVGAAGSDTWKVKAEYDAGTAKLGAQYTDVSVKATGALVSTDMQEIALSVSKSFGPLDTTLAYISTDADDQNQDVNGNGKRFDTVQAYLTLNF